MTTNVTESVKPFAQKLVRFNGYFIMLAGGIAGIIDFLSYQWGIGPWKKFLYQKSYTLGPFEAHWLAFTVGFVLVYQTRSTLEISELKFWINISILIVLNLGMSNIIWWQIFHDTNTIPMGIVATTLHWGFLILHVINLIKLSRYA